MNQPYPSIFPAIIEPFSNFCREMVKQPIHVVLKSLPEITTKDVEALLKITQIGVGIFSLIALSSPLASAGLLAVLTTVAATQDTCRIFRRPLEWIAPISASLIDKDVVLTNVTKLVYNQLNVEHPLGSPGFNQDVYTDLGLSINDQLELHLSNMSATSTRYMRFVDFQNDFQERLNNINIGNGKRVDLTALQQEFNARKVSPFKHISLGAHVSNILWTAVEVTAVTLRLIALQVIEMTIGGYKAFNLEVVLVGLVLGSFLWDIYEASRKLRDEILTPKEREMAQKNRIICIAETLFFFAVMGARIRQGKITTEEILWLGIIVKTIGLFVMKTLPNMFPRPSNI